jgi:hypothetical protein
MTAPARTRRLLRLQRLALLSAAVVGAVGLTTLASSWIALGYHSLSYPTTGAGEAANLVVHRDLVYASRAAHGFEIVMAPRGESIRLVPPPRGSESVDDLATADELLFALDGRPPGHLSVFSLADPFDPQLVSPPIEVDVGPFSGVSAGGGRVIVSGGTSLLSLRSYDRLGAIRPEVATIDLGRGQPDVLLAPDGGRAFVSTHYWGPYFGLTTLEVGSGPSPLVKRGSLDLDTYGFTAGGAKPANFPIEAALCGRFLLVAHRRGLAVVSIADLAKPTLATVVDVGVEPVNVDVRGDLAAVVGSSPKPALVLIDVSSATSPSIVRRFALPEGSYATGVAVGPTFVAVAAHKKGVLLYPRGEAGMNHQSSNKNEKERPC